jgi:glc operon protein GlcG
MKKLLTTGLLAILSITSIMAQTDEREILSDELVDKLCAVAREKSKELGIDISFAVADCHGLPRAYRRYGDALVLSITLVPGKAYTAAVTQCRTKDVAAAEGAPLMAVQACDPRITLVAGGYPLFVDGRIAGGIGVGGGTEEQDCEIAEHVVSVFEILTK